MTYLRQYWADGKGGSTPISADALNYMEAGISAARVDWNVRTVTATTTAAVDDYILVDTTSAAVTITAPAPAAGQVFAVKWIAGTPAPTLSGTFNSGAPVFVAVDQAVEFISDGTKWYRQVRPAAANLADWSQIYGKANGVAPLDGTAKVPVAQLPAGVANGVASLDSTGKVPAAQVPATTPPAAYNAANVTVTGGVSASATTLLTVSSISAGVYNVQFTGSIIGYNNSGTFYGVSLGMAGTGAINSVGILTFTCVNYAQYWSAANGSGGLGAFVQPGNGYGAMTITGTVQVTATSTLSLQAYGNSGWTGQVLQAGAALTLTKIG